MRPDDLTVNGLIIEYIRENKYIVGLYIVYLCIIPLRDIGVPHLFGKLVTAIETKTSLLTPLIYLFAITVVVNFAYSLLDYLEVDITPKMHAFIREKIIRHIVNRTNEDFQEVETGTVLSKLLRLPYALTRHINQWKYTFIPSVVLGLAAIAYFSWYNLILGVLLFILLVLCWGVIVYAIEHCLQYSYESEKIVTRIHEQVTDVIQNLSTVLTNSTEDDEFDDLHNREELYMQRVRETMVCSIKTRFAVVPFNILYFTIFIYICYNDVQSGKMTPATFIALVIIVFRVFNYVWDVSGIINDTTTRWGTLKQSLDVINSYEGGEHPSQQKDKNTTLTTSLIPKTGFYLHDVSYKFTKGGKYVIKNLTLHIDAGKTGVIVGPIGHGKSTLLRLLMKQITPTSGVIYLNGIPYDKVPTDTLRRQIGFVPQNPVLFNRTVLENITYGTSSSRTDVVELLNRLNLNKLVDDLPSGLDTVAGKSGSALSGGQRQIVVILRSVLQNTPIMFMDEPTASMDETTKKMVYDVVSKIIKGRTVLMVTHDPFLLRYADVIIDMKKLIST
jgi:ABC-type multidrug transport system fused ATPase/permease subunit